MNATITAKKDNALTVIRVVVWTFMVGAAVISFTHIIDTGHMLGLGWEAVVAPFLIDGIAIVGKVSMLPRFAEPFRKSGKALLMLGGTLSLAANIAAGDNWGKRAFGVLVVVGFMALENHATKADRTAIAEVEPVTVIDAAAIRTAQKKAADAARTLAAKSPSMRPAELARATGVSAGTAGRILKAVQAIAPVSPGHGPVSAPSAAQIEEIVGTPAYI